MEAMNGEKIVVDVLDSHGRVRWSAAVLLSASARRFTLGRAVTADVVLDDPYVAGLHATIEVAADGSLRASDLGSANGIMLGSHRHHDAQDLSLPEGRLQIGRTRLQLRTAHQVLAPERRDHGLHAGFGRSLPWVAVWGALAWALVIAYLAWLAAPRDTPTAIATGLMGAFAGAGAWIGVWALLSRVMQGVWRWSAHASIFFALAACAFVLDVALDLAWYSFALPAFQWRGPLLGAALLSLLLYLHVGNISTAHRRIATLIAASLPIIVVGTTTWVQLRNQARNPNYIVAPGPLFPPALRVAPSQSADRFFAAAAALRKTAEDNRKATPADEDSGED